MNKIDTSEWQEYNITDLFDFEQIKGDIQAPKTKGGEYPLVSSGKINNGICKYIEKQESSNLFDKNKITIDMFGKVFFQTQKFYSVAHARVNVLTPKHNLNKYTGLYVATAIEAVTLLKYQFSNMCSQKALKTEKIKLPSVYNFETKKYEPDWEYMEKYMRDIETTASASLTKLQSFKNCGHKICVFNWKRFSMVELGFSIYHGTRIKKSDRIDGNTIFITAGKENQGVIGRIGNSVPEWLNPITVDMFGNCFYHNCKCFGDDNIYAFINENLNKYHKWFIASVINAENSAIFSYANQFRQNNADKLSVFLPQTASGEPDWDYMEQYMKDIEVFANNSLNILQSALK